MNIFEQIQKMFGKADITINASPSRLRAARRLREHKAPWNNTPVSTKVTRQQIRRSNILKGRQAMTRAKAEAAKIKGFKGGSAAINTPLDAINFLEYGAHP